MRYGIFSDVHSNLEALETVIEAYKKEAIDRYLCIGDVVGYAANPKECIERVSEFVQITIAGNHDWASVDLFPLNYFNVVAREAIIWTKGNLDDKSRYFLASLKPVYQNVDLTLVHGTLNNPQDFNYLIDDDAAHETLRLLETQICFLGHTHVPGFFIKREDESLYYSQAERIEIKDGNKYIANVGSVGQPRDGNPLSTYCIYDTKEKEVFLKRIGYDFERTRKKIIAAGLPRSLSDRLTLGS